VAAAFAFSSLALSASFTRRSCWSPPQVAGRADKSAAARWVGANEAASALAGDLSRTLPKPRAPNRLQRRLHRAAAAGAC
jgi:hypothetical protein